jgi:hypothetical protein
MKPSAASEKEEGRTGGDRDGRLPLYAPVSVRPKAGELKEETDLITQNRHADMALVVDAWVVDLRLERHLHRFSYMMRTGTRR